MFVKKVETNKEKAKQIRLQLKYLVPHLKNGDFDCCEFKGNLALGLGKFKVLQEFDIFNTITLYYLDKEIDLNFQEKRALKEALLEGKERQDNLAKALENKWLNTIPLDDYYV